MVGSLLDYYKKKGLVTPISLHRSRRTIHLVLTHLNLPNALTRAYQIQPHRLTRSDRADVSLLLHRSRCTTWALVGGGVRGRRKRQLDQRALRLHAGRRTAVPSALDGRLQRVDGWIYHRLQHHPTLGLRKLGWGRRRALTFAVQESVLPRVHAGGGSARCGSRSSQLLLRIVWC
jgi:hypothetical protein